MSSNLAVNVGGKKVDIDTKDLSNKSIIDRNQTVKASLGLLPDIGTTFRIGSQLFKIIYINYGKKRLSVVWVDEKIQPFTGLPELGSSCTIYGQIYCVTFCNVNNKRMTIEPV